MKRVTYDRAVFLSIPHEILFFYVRTKVQFEAIQSSTLCGHYLWFLRITF